MGCQSSGIEYYHQPTHQGKIHPESDSQFSRTGNLVQKNQTTVKKLRLLSDDQLDQFFQLAGHDVDKYFHLIQEKLSEMYMDLSLTTLQNMNKKKFIRNQSKVYITQKILSANLRILKVIGKNNGHNYNIQNFRKLNKIQKGLIGYLKSKYPRSSQSFVPGDLMSVFKQFSIVQHPKNDILKNAQIYFGDAHHKNITKTVKILINKIIDELDTKFPEFQKLCNEKIFTLKKQQGGESVATLNFKIGRKIPQNISKYTDLERDVLEIRDPEIFRVIIKWVSDMQEFLLYPQDEIQQKETFKTVQHEQQNFIFDDINAVQVEAAKSDLMRQLQESKQSYEDEVRGLIKEVDYFNSNLLKILGQAELMQKYIPNNQAQVIKYATYNTKLLSWMVAQKLILVIEKLIKVGQSLQPQHMLIFDLIKFNVTDLMRAMVTGTKKEIFQVFQNMKKLEQEDRISIIKVKNRLATPLNDAMIIFKIKDSFIICQLQLILSERNQGFNEKLKNIETLNHFFYELERSPYGVQSELAILLGFKDSKIIYQNKITYQNTKIDFTLCIKEHPNNVKTIDRQIKPFICSTCTKFYDPFQNFFVTKNCEKCNTYLCQACFFRLFPSEQINVQRIQIKALIRQMIQEKNTEKQKISKETLNFAINVFTQNADLTSLLKIQSIEGRKSGSIKITNIVNYLDSNRDMTGVNLSYFFYVQFKPGTKKIYFLKLNHPTKKLQGVFKIPVDIVSQRIVKYDQYDCIVFLKKKFYQQDKHLDQFLPEHIFSPFKRDFKKEDYNKCDFFRSGKHIIVLDGKQKKTDNQQLQHIQDEWLSNKNFFKFQSLQAARKNLPNVLASKEIYQLADQGIDDTLLKYFEKVAWKNEIKQINIAKNKISSIQPIIQNIMSLQLLYVSQNFISEIDFSKPQQSLRVFNGNLNKIKRIKNWDNLVRVQRIQIQNNILQSIPALKLNKLKIINISYNQIQNSEILQQWQVPQLSHFKCKIAFGYYPKKIDSLTLNFPKLKLISTDYLKSKKLVIKSKRLEKLICISGQMQVLQIQKVSKLQSLNLDMNSISRLDFFQQDQSYDELIEIIVRNNAIMEFPSLKGQNLKIIDFSCNDLKDVSRLSNSYFPNLEQLYLSRNPFSQMVSIPSKKIKKICLSQTAIRDTSFFQNQEYPFLKSVQLEFIQTLTSICKLKANNLEELLISHSGIEKLQSDLFSNYKKLTKLKLQNPSLTQIGPLDLPELTQLDLTNVMILNCDFLTKSNLPKVQTLNVRNCGFKENVPEQQKSRTLPIMNLPGLKYLDINNSSFKNIQAIAYCKFPNIESINLASNPFKHMPTLNFSKLTNLYTNNCQIENLQIFSKSQLPQLDFIDISSNNLRQFPILNAPKLTQISFNGNPQLNISNFQLVKFQGLKNISFYDQKVSIMPKFNLKGLEKFQMTSCTVRDMKKFGSSDFPKMTHLFFYQIKQLKEINPLNFPQLKNLTFLGSELSDITFLCNSRIPQLAELCLQANKIKILPNANFPKLRIINLCDNLIQDFSNLERWGQDIQQIHVRKNKIKKMPKMKFFRLHTLSISDNILEDMSQLANCQLPQMTQLQISRNDSLKSLPQSKSLSLQSFYMDNCQIQSIQQLIVATKISSISGGYNLISKVPCFEKNQLRQINLESCKIVDIKQFCAGTYPLLDSISFPNNQIEKVYKLDCPSLLYLSLNSNQISDIDQLGKSNLPSLVRIDMQMNKIKKVGYLAFKKLSQIDFSQNQIQSIDQFFGGQYKTLTYALFRKNKIKKVKAKIFAQKIAYIQLGENQIQSLSDLSFLDGHVKTFESINLDGNKIKKLSKIYIGKKALGIYVNNNPITQISEIFTWEITKDTCLNLSIDFDSISDKTVIFQQITKLAQLCILVVYDMNQNYLDANNIKVSLEAAKQAEMQAEMYRQHVKNYQQKQLGILQDNINGDQGDINQENLNQNQLNNSQENLYENNQNLDT